MSKPKLFKVTIDKEATYHVVSHDFRSAMNRILSDFGGYERKLDTVDIELVAETLYLDPTLQIVEAQEHTASDVQANEGNNDVKL